MPASSQGEEASCSVFAGSGQGQGQGQGSRVAVVVVAVLGAAGCTEKKVASDDPSAQVVEVALSDVGCEPNSMSAKAGATTFAVSNEDSSGVTEFELMTEDRGRVLGEAENVGPGLESSFSLNLEAGSYTTYCPGGSKEYGTLEVAEADTGQTGDPAAQQAAVTTYLTYVQQQADEGVVRAEQFAAAVNAGDLAESQSLFAWPREPYESIEPIAESFGDLDPLIDAREGDVPFEEWTGFHRIEQALWVDQTTAGIGPVADQLVVDIATLHNSIPTVGARARPDRQRRGRAAQQDLPPPRSPARRTATPTPTLPTSTRNVAGAKAAFDAVVPLLAATSPNW